MHRDDPITKKEWEAMVEGMTSRAASIAANWIKHGARLTKQSDGIRMDRKDWMRGQYWRCDDPRRVAETPSYRFVDNEGNESMREAEQGDGR